MYLEQFAGTVRSQTVDEVTQLMNAAFPNVLQVLSQTELYSILNAWVFADTTPHWSVTSCYDRSLIPILKPACGTQ